MSDPANQSESTEDLQFNTAEATAARPVVTIGGGTSCAGCGQAIAGTYYAVADKVICPSCRDRLTPAPTGNKGTRFLKASLFGIGAGLAGAAIWFAIRRIAHIEMGLIAVLVGFMVGKAVRKGSGNLGGRG